MNFPDTGFIACHLKLLHCWNYITSHARLSFAWNPTKRMQFGVTFGIYPRPYSPRRNFASYLN